MVFWDVRISTRDQDDLPQYFTNVGTAVAQSLRYCAINRKVAGSIPDINPSGPGVDSASSTNEYQEYFLGENTAGA
jgi:hypothetical protein